MPNKKTSLVNGTLDKESHRFRWNDKWHQVPMGNVLLGKECMRTLYSAFTLLRESTQLDLRVRFGVPKNNLIAFGKNSSGNVHWLTAVAVCVATNMWCKDLSGNQESVVDGFLANCGWQPDVSNSLVATLGKDRWEVIKKFDTDDDRSISKNNELWHWLIEDVLSNHDYNLNDHIDLWRLAYRSDLSPRRLLELLESAVAIGILERVLHENKAPVYTFRSVSRSEVEESMQVRQLIEPWFIDRVFSRGDTEMSNIRKKLEAIQERMTIASKEENIRKFVIEDIEFHLALASEGKFSSRALRALLTVLNTNGVINLGRTSKSRRNAMNTILSEHQNILEHLQSRSLEKAKEAISQHLAAAELRMLSSSG